MIDRSRCLRRQPGFCVGWRAAVTELPLAAAGFAADSHLLTLIRDVREAK